MCTVTTYDNVVYSLWVRLFRGDHRIKYVEKGRGMKPGRGGVGWREGRKEKEGRE
jgi:hypothetical protein